MDPGSDFPSKASALAGSRHVSPGYRTNPTHRKLRAIYAKYAYAEITGTRTRVYVLVSVWLALWTIVQLYIVTSVFSNAVLFLSLCHQL